MNDFFIIVFKTAVFVFSYFIISNRALKFFKKNNTSSDLYDIEIITVSVISSAFITSAAKHILKFFLTLT